MATIGLDKPYYAIITEDANGQETYDTPKVMAKAIQADLTVNNATASLYADDGVDESVDEFTSGTLSLGLNDLASTVAAELLGARVDTNGVLVNSTNDIAPYVAVGFRARKANGKYRYFWLYRVKFGVPATNLATKGESITFQTPTIEGTVMRRNKPDTQDKHPWKTEVTDGDTGVSAATISGWFSAVYEPTFYYVTADERARRNDHPVRQAVRVDFDHQSDQGDQPALWRFGQARRQTLKIREF